MYGRGETCWNQFRDGKCRGPVDRKQNEWPPPEVCPQCGKRRAGWMSPEQRAWTVAMRQRPIMPPRKTRAAKRRLGGAGRGEWARLRENAHTALKRPVTLDSIWRGPVVRRDRLKTQAAPPERKLKARPPTTRANPSTYSRGQDRAELADHLADYHDYDANNFYGGDFHFWNYVDWA